MKEKERKPFRVKKRVKVEGPLTDHYYTPFKLLWVSEHVKNSSNTLEECEKFKKNWVKSDMKRKEEKLNLNLHLKSRRA